jgi:hypothetical protein
MPFTLHPAALQRPQDYANCSRRHDVAVVLTAKLHPGDD